MIPRYYQQAAHDASWHYLANQAGNPLVVLPTGAGKSLTIAMAVQQARAFDARVIVLQHRKELIQQNAEKIQILIPDIKIGINSAGLKSSSFSEDVICCGIQSVYRKAHEFGRRELILIDEVHLVGGRDDSMYGQFLADIKTINPKARLIGYTATPYRTGEGPICGRDKLFQRICHEAFTGDLIREGYLCPLTNKPAVATVDSSLVKTRGSEFINSDAERAFLADDNVMQACREIVEKCHDRKSILVFSSGVHHAESIAETLRELTGERVGIVTGETWAMEREKLLSDFKSGTLRWLINCDVLTTGFDAPRIDAIAVLRMTMSPGLFAQIVGRGLRMHESKGECLILDFGGNIARHGSLDDPNYGRASVNSRGSGTGEAAEKNGRGKECFNCGLDVAANARECPECGFLFPVNHDASADESSTLTGKPDPEVWIVQSVAWGRHVKKNAPDAPNTLRIDYTCQPDGEPVTEIAHQCKYNCGGLVAGISKNGPHNELKCKSCGKHQKFVAKAETPIGNLTETIISEWVCIEHQGYARVKAVAWWDARSEHPAPQTIDEAMQLLDAKACRQPVTITTEQDGKYRRIASVTWRDEKPAELELFEYHVPGDAVYFDDDEVPF